MTRHVHTLLWAAVRSVRHLLGGRVQFPRERLGDVLESPDGDSFVVYRETALGSDDVDRSGDPVVLVFRMSVSGREAGESVRDVLFDPLANVATPFFVGMPGFRRKLWLAGSRPGEFLELYEWESRADAERFVDALQSLLAPFDAAGSASFEVVDDDSVDAYVDRHAVQWRSGSDRDGSRSRISVAGTVAVVVGAVVVGVLLWKRRSRLGETRTDA
jgi:hypothetical protein